MQRVSMGLAAVFLLATVIWPAPQTWAQQPKPPGAAGYAGLFERWQQTSDPEQRIALGEQLLAREPALARWPLQTAREAVKAEIWFGLGSAYVARLRGVRGDNLEKAITHLDAVLGVWTREADQQNWARAHNNIGIAYWARIRGEPADNQEKAIAHFEAALTIFSHEAAPLEWAQLQNNLATVYVNRTLGLRSSNIETAITHFETAQKVFTREAHPNLWARIQNNLGIAYGSRVDGARADNREKAIAYLEAALTVFTRDSAPHEWGSAQHNLASGYLSRDRGEPSENQEKAIAHLENALRIFTPEAFPQQWAKTQSTLGNAFADRIRGERGSNQQKAIAAYDAALSAFTREAFPLEHMRSAQRLGRVLLDAGDWRRAGAAHGSAREAFLLLFGQGLEEAEARQLIASAGPLFAEAAFGALQRGETEAAFELADEGRARLMAVALQVQALDLPARERRRLDELRIAIRTAQQAVDAARGLERTAAIDKLVALRQELLGLVTSGNPDREKPRSALSKAREFIGTGSVVAVPVVTKFGGKLLLVTKAPAGQALVVVDLPELTTDRLSELLIGPGDGPPAGWLSAYFINYLDSVEQARRWPEWTAAIDGLGPKLWSIVGARFAAALTEHGVKPGTRLVWLPSGWLGVLPLGLAQNPDSQRRFADDYEIVYAPNLEALVGAQRAVANAGPATLAAIINPTGDLPGTEKEGAIVASHFAAGARTLLEQGNATPEAVLAGLKGKSYWHFASHGTFSWSDARQSALLMHGQARLSVGRLLETDGLGRPRLVVLSACETGLFEITSSPDEFIGLPGTFTALGAAGVVGTLWPVSDAATALLIAKFYELHMIDRHPPPTALHRAQAWLRNATNVDLGAYAKSAAAQGRLQRGHLVELEQALSVEELTRSRNAAIVERGVIAQLPETKAKSATDNTASANEDQLARPYAHPYFWAGFVYTGL